MTWSAFWTQYNSFISVLGSIANCVPSIVLTMVFAPLLFAIMYGFVHMVRRLRI